MSETASSGNWFAHLMASISQGAASVFHQAVAAESNIASWSTSPVVGALVNEGLSVAQSFASRMGVPAAAVNLVASDVLGAMHSMASSDSTVNSGAGIPAAAATPTPPAVATPDAETAPAVAAATTPEAPAAELAAAATS